MVSLGLLSQSTGLHVTWVVSHWAPTLVRIQLMSPVPGKRISLKTRTTATAGRIAGR